MRDGFDAPPVAPNDFPTDPVVHHHVMAWLALIVIVAVAVACLTLAFKSAEKMVRGRLGEGVDTRVKAVRKALEAAAKAQAADQVALAQAARTAIDDQFGRTLQLSSDIGKAIDGLNKALEGMREEEVRPKSGLPAGAVVNGGTVINIAVANGALTDVPAGAAATPETASPPTAEEQSESLWRSVQRLFAYWSNMNVVSAAFRAAQQQLLHSPPWTEPREEALPEPAEAPRFRFLRREPDGRT